MASAKKKNTATGGIGGTSTTQQTTTTPTSTTSYLNIQSQPYFDKSLQYTDAAAKLSTAKNPFNNAIGQTYKAVSNAKPITSKYQQVYNQTLKNALKQGDFKDPYEALRSGMLKNLNPGEFSSPYDAMADEVLELMKQPYDPNKDDAYIAYKNQYTKGGQQAMQDTMAQAAALTGGFGSSYGQSVGQQVYGDYMTALADKIPELARAAQEMYQNQLNNYITLGNRDYSRFDADRGYNLSALGALDNLTNTALGIHNANVGNKWNKVDALGGAFDRDVNLQNTNRGLLMDKYNAALGGGNYAETYAQNRMNNLLGIADSYADIFSQIEALQSAASGGSGGGNKSKNPTNPKNPKNSNTDIIEELRYGNKIGLSPTTLAQYAANELQNEGTKGLDPNSWFQGEKQEIPAGAALPMYIAQIQRLANRR